MKRLISIIFILIFAMCTCTVAFASEADEYETMLISESPEGFYDIGEEHYAYDAAKNLYSKGYIDGDKGGKVYPDNQITREEAVKIALAINKVATENGIEITAPDFDKVSEWAKDIIATAYKYGVIRGDEEDGSLRPMDNITRAELLAVAMRALNVQIDGVSLEFTDVPGDSWYYSYIGAASELGIVTGYEDGTFKPEDDITRADSFVIFDRILTLRTALENAAMQ